MREGRGRGRRPYVAVAGGVVLMYVVATWSTNFHLLAQQSSDDGGYAAGAAQAQAASHGGRPLPSLRPPAPGLLAPGAQAPNFPVTDAASYRLATGRSDRVYCAVPTTNSEQAAKLRAGILQSWGPRCDVLKFFTDAPAAGEAAPPASVTSEDGRFSAEVVPIAMKRSGKETCSDGMLCRHIWEKVWRMWVHVYMHDLASAEWFMKVDDDTYLLPSNVRRFVRGRGWSAQDPHYFGFLVNVEVQPWRLISGVASAFSRTSIDRLGARLLSMKHEYGPRDRFPHSHGLCVDRDGATEERVTSRCLSEVGVFAEASLEDETREHVLPLGLPFTLTYKRRPTTTSWFWDNKPYSRGDAIDCCSNSAWGIHGYKSSKRMAEMETMMTVPMRELDENLERRKLKEDDNVEGGYLHWLYIRRLRQAIYDDPFAYPKMTNRLL